MVRLISVLSTLTTEITKDIQHFVANLKQWNNGTINDNVKLETSNLDRFLINFIIVPFHSSSQIDCSFPVIPIIFSCCVKMIPPLKIMIGISKV